MPGPWIDHCDGAGFIGSRDSVGPGVRAEPPRPPAGYTEREARLIRLADMHFRDEVDDLAHELAATLP